MKIKIKSKGFNNASVTLKKESKTTARRLFDLKARKEILMRAEKDFYRLRAEYVTKFQNHEVTQALLDGKGTAGVIPTGTLKSFIGLTDDDVNSQLAAIEEMISKSRVFVSTTGDMRVRITLAIPDKEEIFAITPLPWTSGGRSWARSLESGGIAGYGHYMYDEGGRFARWSTRTGEAIQVDNKIRGGRAKQVKYISELINDFKKDIRNII